MAISLKAKLLIDEYRAAAELWGWERDQGWGSGPDRAEARMKRAAAALKNYIINLEDNQKEPSNGDEES